MKIIYNGRVVKRLFPSEQWIVPITIKRGTINTSAEMLFTTEHLAEAFHDNLYDVFKIEIGE